MIDLRANHHSYKVSSPTDTIQGSKCAKCGDWLGFTTAFGDYVKGFRHLKCLTENDTIAL